MVIHDALFFLWIKLVVSQGILWSPEKKKAVALGATA